MTDDLFAEAYEERMSGVRFGKLVVIERGPDAPYKCRGKTYLRRKWRCRCDCGGETISFEANLKNGRSTSCGCNQREHARQLGLSKKRHGFAHSKEESAWRHAHQRCNDKSSDQYKNYGDRGITVCERWKSFENFLADMGPAPSKKHSLERINTNLGYSPENCRWATWKDQQRNRRNNFIVEKNGERKPLAEWCELLGLNYSRVHARLRVLGWSVDRAFAK